MGFSISWYAVREENAQRLLDLNQLTPTGETEEVPESLITTASMRTGWRVLWYNEYECPFMEDEDLATISREMEVIAVRVEEHVMVSSAESWLLGKRTWFLGHNGEDGPKGLIVEGKAPAALGDIRREMERAQVDAGGEDADVDYMFEIPLRVAQSIVGFKHDESSDAGFTTLSRPEKKGFLRGLFGR